MLCDKNMRGKIKYTYFSCFFPFLINVSIILTLSILPVFTFHHLLQHELMVHEWGQIAVLSPIIYFHKGRRSYFQCLFQNTYNCEKCIARFSCTPKFLASITLNTENNNNVIIIIIIIISKVETWTFDLFD